MRLYCMSLLSGLGRSHGFFGLKSLLQACFDELVQTAIKHGLRIAGLYAGPEIFDPALIQYIRPYLISPSDVCLAVFYN